MQVTKLSSDNAMAHCHEVKKQTDEELQREYDYYIARIIVDRMYSKGLISEKELKAIIGECGGVYKPSLLKLMD